MTPRDLVEAVDRLPRSAVATEAVRHVAPGFLPASGEGARVHGGRWNPPDSFPVLYAALDRPTMVAELARAARRQGLALEDLLPRDEVRLRVTLSRVLELRDPVAGASVGLTQDDIAGSDWSRCQAVGDAAHRAGFEAIAAPSSTGSGSVLAVLFDRLVAGSRVDVVAVTALSGSGSEPGG